MSLTRYPPGLLKALQVMDAGGIRPSTVTAGTSHLWLADPEPMTEVDRERRAPLGLRIDVLAEL